MLNKTMLSEREEGGRENVKESVLPKQMREYLLGVVIASDNS